MISEIHPALPLIFFTYLALLKIPSQWRSLLFILGPALALGAILLGPDEKSALSFSFMGQSLQFMKWDSLSVFFALILSLFTFLANIYALHETRRVLWGTASIYAASSLGAVFAGDLITLFIFWEIMAIASTFLIWNPNRPRSYGALFRYFLVHLTGGLCFFAGILVKLTHHQSMVLGPMELDLGGMLIFTGFAVNAALVPLHAWLPDAYPEGTPVGSVYLSCFTTKVAVYAFARCFPGEPLLLWLGVITAVYGVIFALLENDIRRLLAYHIVCQVGYMVAGIALGTELGINAGVGHAFGNILFKGLLFMATGAILYQTGATKLTELGGLAQRMRPILIYFYVGALAISGLPLLNGYVTKSLLFDAAIKAHMPWLEMVFLLVAVGTFLSIALKLGFFTFWGEQKFAGKLKPLPPNMRLAMTGTAAICFYIGLFPAHFFSWMPFELHENPYTASHIIHTLQLLAGTWFGFIIIQKSIHLKDQINLDLDWFYRKGAVALLHACRPLRTIQEHVQSSYTVGLQRLHENLGTLNRHKGLLSVENALSMMVRGGLILFVLILLLKITGLN